MLQVLIEPLRRRIAQSNHFSEEELSRAFAIFDLDQDGTIEAGTSPWRTLDTLF